MASSAERFFETITTHPDPVAFLRRLVNSAPPTTEEEWLDFKGFCQDADSKNLWSKALSAFANTEGGVLIWGIDARKNSDGVDAASSFRLIQNPSAFKSRLLELHHQATDPPVAGVEIREYVADAKTNEGFVVCLVPESDYKPHRSEYPTHKPYYIRAGDDFVIPSPALLRYLFHPKSNCFLWIEMLCRSKLANNGVTEVSIEVRVHNSGTATANDVVIVVQHDWTGDVSRANTWGAVGNPQGRVAYEGIRPLHPEAVSTVFEFRGRVHRGKVEQCPGRLACRFLLYARDSVRQILDAVFEDDEIQGQVTKQFKAGKVTLIASARS